MLEKICNYLLFTKYIKQLVLFEPVRNVSEKGRSEGKIQLLKNIFGPIQTMSNIILDL